MLRAREESTGTVNSVASANSATATSIYEESTHGYGRFINRELSWLEFGCKLLDLADDSSLALMERVKFLAIFSEGLDEFYQVRVAGLKDQVDAGLRSRLPDMGHGAWDMGRGAWTWGVDMGRGHGTWGVGVGRVSRELQYGILIG